ncbi:aminodeoxychorismate lyase [Thalassomonas sp. M1454]|uniref:aminodeoxychorismate lyase n=1 Tax=Thalassomonas sp. M1454 TaxID=2594477 RepID=UPI00117D4DC9|nr:aminodeoxychorismate lyase [Thalassomonas sp. M1454]TRX56648.1 aminodeoxychorismate lyase [Thalassomonas sp. M1454]
MLYHSVNFTTTEQLSIRDRGLAFGDGIFTTAQIVAGQVQHLGQHIKRLQQGCLRLGIEEVNWASVEAELNKAANSVALSLNKATLKVIITAGNSSRGYSRVGIKQANIIVTVSAFPEHYIDWQNKGISLGVSSVKLGHNPVLAGLKHLNRLEQVLVRNELDTLDVDEVVVTDIADNIIECNTANIFWLKDDIWYTPSLSMAGVSGIIREQVINVLAQDGHQVAVVDAKVDVLKQSDAIFICNSLLTIAPVKEFVGKAFSMEPIKAIQKRMQKEFE